MIAFEKLLTEIDADAVVVAGDVNSTGMRSLEQRRASSLAMWSPVFAAGIGQC